MQRFIIIIITIWLFACGQQAQEQSTSVEPELLNTIRGRIETPTGYNHILQDSNSFGFFLQNMVLKPKGSPVRLFNGELKSNQHIHAAVVDMDIGNRDLQQCADAVMRLRADYLYSQKRFDEIAFNFVSDGKPRYFTNFCSQVRDSNCYKKYLNYIFGYANTRSLKKQLQPVASIMDMQIGDVFIQQGNPYGHAVIVVAMAIDNKTGEKIYLLAQSFMPAQDIHVLVNPNDDKLSPWYKVSECDDILTPEWRFKKEDLRRF